MPARRHGGFHKGQCCAYKRHARRADCSGPNQTGMFPQAPAYRLQEIRYALTQLPTLPNVNMSKLVLFGHSEGGND